MAAPEGRLRGGGDPVGLPAAPGLICSALQSCLVQSDPAGYLPLSTGLSTRFQFLLSSPTCKPTKSSVFSSDLRI